MKIIVDGNDGVGKTTLAKKLQEYFNIKSYMHLSAKDPRNFNFYYHILFKEDIIFDRSFMDEIIYSKVLKRTCMLTEYEDVTLHDTVKNNKIIVIICHTNNKKYSYSEASAIIAGEYEIDNYFFELSKKYNYIYFNPKEDSFKSLIEEITSSS